VAHQFSSVTPGSAVRQRCRRGLQRYIVLFFIELSTRQVEIAGIRMVRKTKLEHSRPIAGLSEKRNDLPNAECRPPAVSFYVFDGEKWPIGPPCHGRIGHAAQLPCNSYQVFTPQHGSSSSACLCSAKSEPHAATFSSQYSWWSPVLRQNAVRRRVLRCNTFITVIQTAELRDRDNPSDARDPPRKWTLFCQVPSESSSCDSKQNRK
jgi:hypothetical protein